MAMAARYHEMADGDDKTFRFVREVSPAEKEKTDAVFAAIGSKPDRMRAAGASVQPALKPPTANSPATRVQAASPMASLDQIDIWGIAPAATPKHIGSAPTATPKDLGSVFDCGGGAFNELLDTINSAESVYAVAA